MGQFNSKTAQTCLRAAAAAAAKSIQSCPTLCDPIDGGPLSLGFSRQEYWSGLPFPPAEDLPDPGIEPMSLYISCIGR